MPDNVNQTPQKSADAAKTGASKFILPCFILSNLLFSYQLFIMLGDAAFGAMDMFRVPLLTNSLIPLALVVACILISVSQKAQTYNTKAAVTMFVVAVVCHLLPSVLYSTVDVGKIGFDFMMIINMVFNVAKYFCLAFGYCNMFLEPKKQLKPYVLCSLILPCMIGVGILIAKPEWGITLLVMLVLFVVIMNARAKLSSLSVKQKDMIKGAVIGDLIAGDGGAVVGAMIAKDKHENK